MSILLRFASLPLAVTLAIPFASAQDVLSVSSIPEFHQVTEYIYRGGRPETTGVEELARLGVKTIIDIDDDSRSSRSEAREAGRWGMRYIAKPMNPFRSPSDRQVNELLAMLQDESLYPIFFHCHHGQDRTGMIFGIYRVEHDGWTARRAYEEMLEYGFHPQLTGLDRYFKRRTEY